MKRLSLILLTLLVASVRAAADDTKLVINEIQVTNIDQFIDPSFNYGGWVELYNPTSEVIKLAKLVVSDNLGHTFTLPANMTSVPAGGFTNLWFDHNSSDAQYSSQAFRQVPFKLQYEGGTITISDANGKVLATQTYPAAIQRVSYARTTDGGSTWAFTGEPTPAASNNGAHWYTIAAFAVLTVIGAILWIRSFTAKEPYATKAEHRKQRALWRSAKRWSVCLLVCFIAGVLCATWFVKLNTVVIREAPVEEPQIVKNGAGEADELRVPLEMVADGHLHRFGYTTPDGKLTRFIVVLKQENTNNYGVGLDACEICGEAGYYENNEGQVVCKKCNVVMNRTTIGMKGGCNPIIIDYDINEAYITVPVEEMVKNQSRFN